MTVKNANLLFFCYNQYCIFSRNLYYLISNALTLQIEPSQNAIGYSPLLPSIIDSRQRNRRNSHNKMECDMFPSYYIFCFALLLLIYIFMKLAITPLFLFSKNQKTTVNINKNTGIKPIYFQALFAPKNNRRQLASMKLYL